MKLEDAKKLNLTALQDMTEEIVDLIANVELEDFLAVLCLLALVIGAGAIFCCLCCILRAFIPRR